MAINFPGSLDNFTNPTSASPINSPSHADQHANANDAIEALEAKVGIDGSSVVTSHDYKIAQLQSLVTSAVAGAKSIYQDVRNQSGSAFTKATPVYVSGSTGASGQLLVSAASNATEATSSKTMGITTSAISNNSNGQVISEGILEGIDTTGAADGDPVWLGVNGAKIYGLANKPSAPAHLVFLGVVIRGGQANTGSMYVKIQNGFELHELHNVEISSLVNGNILAYDSTTQTWKNTNTLQSTSSTTPLVVKASASQSVDIFQIQNSSGNPIFYVNQYNQLIGNQPIYQYNTLYLGSPANSAIPLIVRGAASQTANLQEWQNNNGTALSYINPSGVFVSTAGIYLQVSGGNGYGIQSTAGSASTVPIIVQGAASQTANLQQWQNNTGTILSKIDANGAITILPPTNAVVGLTIQAPVSPNANLIEFKDSTGTVQGYIHPAGRFIGDGAFTNSFQRKNTTGAYIDMINTTASVMIVGRTTTTAPNFIIRAMASQTGDLQQWQNVGGTVLSGVNTAGQLYLGSSSVVQSGAVGLASVTGDGTNATYTATSGYTVANPFTAGAKVTISGYTGITGYNGTFTISSVGGTSGAYTFTVPNTTTGTPGGTGASYQSVDLSLTSKNPWSTPFVIKAAASQATNLLEFQNSSGTALTYFNSSGGLTATEGVMSTLYSGGKMTTGTLGYFNATTFNASTIPVVVRGAASQTADLQQWQDSSGTVLASLSPTLNSAVALNFTSNYSIKIKWGGSTILYTDPSPSTLIASPYSADRIGFIVRGLPSQTANLQEWQNSSGTVLAKVDASGNITSTSLTAIGGTSQIGTANFYTNGNVVISNTLSSPYLNISYAATIGGAYNQLPLLVKAVASQTANLQEWQDSNGNALALVNSSGAIITGGVARATNGGIFGGTTQLSSAGLTVYTTAAGNPGAIIRGTASQTADLQQWQNSSGTVLSSISASGYLNTQGVISGSAGIRSDAAVGVNTTPFTDSAQLAVSTNGASYKGLLVRGVASQTANLQEWQNSSGTILAKVDSNGNILTNNISYSYSLPDSGASSFTWMNIGTWTTVQNGSALKISVDGKAGYNAQSVQLWNSDLYFVTSNDSSYQSALDSNAFYAAGLAYRNTELGSSNVNIDPKFRILQNSKTSYTIYVKVYQWLGAAKYSVSMSQGTSWTNNATNIGSTAPTGTVIEVTPTSSVSTAGGSIIVPNSASTNGLIIRAAASQTADLQVWQDSGGTVLTNIDKNGYIRTPLVEARPTNAGLYGLFIGANASQSGDLFQVADSSNNAYTGISSTGKFVTGNTTNASRFTQITDAALGQLTVYSPSASTKSIVVRGATSQTANLQEWQRSGGNADLLVTNFGTLISGGGTTIASNPTINAYGAAMKIASGINTYPMLILQAAASQSANIQEWQDSSGTVKAKVTSGGSIDTDGVLGAQFAAFGANRSYIDNTALRVLTNGSNVGVIVKSYAGNTANLQEWQNSAGTVLAKVDSTGKITSNVDASINGFIIGKGSATTGTSNIAFGLNALANNTTGNGNFAIGYGVLQSNTTGSNNFALGANSLVNSTTGDLNMALGSSIMFSLTTGYYNVGVGYNALNAATTGRENMAIGISALSALTTGAMNTAIGQGSGSSITTSNSNIFIGYNAGANETGSNKLYIANSNTSTPLIGGDFSTNALTISGNVNINSQSASTAPLIIKHAASPSSSYFEVRNSAGNPIWGINSAGEALTRTTTKFGANIQNDSSNNYNALYVQGDGSGNGIPLYVKLWSGTKDIVKFDNGGVVKLSITSDGSLKGGNSNTISVNTASTVDTVALSSFTSMEYTLSIKQGSKIRSSKVLVHTDGTSVDSTEYGIMEMGGVISGILVTASVSSTNAILQVTITDAATTNATVKLIKTML